MEPTQTTESTSAHTPEPWKAFGTKIKYLFGSGLTETIADVRGGSFGEDDTAHANARRICAAVNACQGLSTEALERGVIADLRHVLGELLAAAGDLDAAIDGVTDQFDAERARLNTACRNARSALDSDTTIDIHELLTGRQQIAAIWSIEDVQQVRPDLTDDQAWEVLYQVGRKHDAEYGINWTTLEGMADILFGPAPETATEEE